VEHEELPPAVGCCALDQARVDVVELVEPVVLHQLHHELVVLGCGVVEAVGPVRRVGVAMVGAGHESDPLARAGCRVSEGSASCDVGLGGEVAGRADDDRAHARVGAPAEVPERDERAPVHGHHGFCPAVAAEAHADG
jgi:hypothetical protein